jgi:hypothetical protein
VTQIPGIFKLDFLTGMVICNGKLRCPKVGFNIGSPLGPGGASLLASGREADLMNSLPSGVVTRFLMEVLCMRWVDDVWITYHTSLSTEVREVVNQLCEPNFYGGALRLERSKAMDPFGFVSTVEKNQLVVTRSLKYRASMDTDVRFHKEFTVPSGARAFAPPASQRSVAQGMLLRALDMTSAPAATLLKQLGRGALKLRSLQFDTRVIRRCEDAVRRVATQPLPRFTEDAMRPLEYVEVAKLVDDGLAYLSAKLSDAVACNIEGE